MATPPTTLYARNALSSPVKKYDLSARRTKGASVSTPHAETSDRATSRSRASCRRRYRHGASHDARSHAAPERPTRKTDFGNHSPTSPARCEEPRRLRPSAARVVSRKAKATVKGWSAMSRFTQSAAPP